MKIDENYDYHEALNKSIEEIREEQESSWLNRNREDELER